VTASILLQPLSDRENSAWSTYFKDKELMEEINKDVQRTYPDLHFFCDDTRHYRALHRSLFIYAKLNPGIRYVQGMNEIYAPIYYVLANDQNPESREHAERDAFFCFVHLMSDIRDHFCESLDHSESGIKGSLSQMMSILKSVDHELWENLKSKQINPQFYGLRWLSLLLSQEFDLPDLLRLWDSLFSVEDPTQFLLQFCCVMLMHVRHELLCGDFGENIKLLQSFPSSSAAGPTDINMLLRKTTELRSTIANELKNIEVRDQQNQQNEMSESSEPLAASLSNASGWARAKARSLFGWE